jgi:hypothetical protein
VLKLSSVLDTCAQGIHPWYGPEIKKGFSAGIAHWGARRQAKGLRGLSVLCAGTRWGADRGSKRPESALTSCAMFATSGSCNYKHTHNKACQEGVRHTGLERKAASSTRAAMRRAVPGLVDPCTWHNKQEQGGGVRCFSLRQREWRPPWTAMKC